MEEIIRFAVFAIIEGVPDKSGILLIQDKGKPAPHFWKLPGGKGEKGEHPEWTLARELEEELGIEVSNILPTDIIFRKKAADHEFLVYKAAYDGGEIKEGNEIQRISFFSLEEIKKMLIGNEILPKHAIALAQYFLLS